MSKRIVDTSYPNPAHDIENHFSIRALLLIGAIGYTIFGILSNIQLELQDPMWIRYLFSTILLIMFFTSFLMEEFFTYFIDIFNLMLIFFNFHFVYLVYLNDVSTLSITYELIFLLAISIAHSYIFTKQIHIWSFLLIQSSLSILILVITESSNIVLYGLIKITIISFMSFSFRVSIRTIKNIIELSEYFNLITSNPLISFFIVDIKGYIQTAEGVDLTNLDIDSTQITNGTIHISTIFDNNDNLIEECLFKASNGEQVRKQLRHSNSFHDCIFYPLHISNVNNFHIAVLTFDITDKIMVQQELKQQQSYIIQFQKLEAVGRLAGAVVHDFNNILAIILLNNEHLMEYHDTLSSKEIHQIVETIQNAGERATVLVNRLLGFSRYQPHNPVIINPSKTILNSLPVLQQLVSPNIILSFNSPSEALFVKFDENQFLQVIMNLVINARDAISEKGEITIEIQPDTSKTSPDFLMHGYVSIIITDSGTGISTNDIDRVFDAFFTTKKMGKGTGLGLFSVKTILSRHDATISVESIEGDGTIFCIKIPQVQKPVDVVEGREKDENLQDQDAQKSNGYNVMVVDDETVIRDMIVNFLKGKGFNVASTESGESALELYDTLEDGLDFLVTDIIMEGIDGIGLSSELNKMQENLKIILISGYSNTETKRFKGLEFEYSFLKKPFSLQELEKCINKMVDN